MSRSKSMVYKNYFSNDFKLTEYFLLKMFFTIIIICHFSVAAFIVIKTKKYFFKKCFTNCLT